MGELVPPDQTDRCQLSFQTQEFVDYLGLMPRVHTQKQAVGPVPVSPWACGCAQKDDGDDVPADAYVECTALADAGGDDIVISASEEEELVGYTRWPGLVPPDDELESSEEEILPGPEECQGGLIPGGTVHFDSEDHIVPDWPVTPEMMATLTRLHLGPRPRVSPRHSPRRVPELQLQRPQRQRPTVQPSPPSPSQLSNSPRRRSPTNPLHLQSPSRCSEQQGQEQQPAAPKPFVFVPFGDHESSSSRSQKRPLSVRSSSGSSQASQGCAMTRRRRRFSLRGCSFESEHSPGRSSQRSSKRSSSSRFSLTGCSSDSEHSPGRSSQRSSKRSPSSWAPLHYLHSPPPRRLARSPGYIDIDTSMTTTFSSGTSLHHVTAVSDAPLVSPDGDAAAGCESLSPVDDPFLSDVSTLSSPTDAGAVSTTPIDEGRSVCRAASSVYVDHDYLMLAVTEIVEVEASPGSSDVDDDTMTPDSLEVAAARAKPPVPYDVSPLHRLHQHRVNGEIQRAVESEIVGEGMQNNGQQTEDVVFTQAGPQGEGQHAEDEDVVLTQKAPQSEGQHIEDKYVVLTQKDPQSEGQHAEGEDVVLTLKDPQSEGQHAEGEDVVLTLKDPQSEGQHAEGEDVDLTLKDPQSEGQHAEGEDVVLTLKDPQSEGQHAADENIVLMLDPHAAGQHTEGVLFTQMDHQAEILRTLDAVFAEVDQRPNDEVLARGDEEAHALARLVHPEPERPGPSADMVSLSFEEQRTLDICQGNAFLGNEEGTSAADQEDDATDQEDDDADQEDDAAYQDDDAADQEGDDGVPQGSESAAVFTQMWGVAEVSPAPSLASLDQDEQEYLGAFGGNGQPDQTSCMLGSYSPGPSVKRTPNLNDSLRDVSKEEEFNEAATPSKIAQNVLNTMGALSEIQQLDLLSTKDTFLPQMKTTSEEEDKLSGRTLSQQSTTNDWIVDMEAEALGRFTYYKEDVEEELPDILLQGDDQPEQLNLSPNENPEELQRLSSDNSTLSSSPNRDLDALYLTQCAPLKRKVTLKKHKQPAMKRTRRSWEQWYDQFKSIVSTGRQKFVAYSTLPSVDNKENEMPLRRDSQSSELLCSQESPGSRKTQTSECFTSYEQQRKDDVNIKELEHDFPGTKWKHDGSDIRKINDQQVPEKTEPHTVQSGCSFNSAQPRRQLFKWSAVEPSLKGNDEDYVAVTDEPESDSVSGYPSPVSQVRSVVRVGLSKRARPRPLHLRKWWVMIIQKACVLQ